MKIKSLLSIKRLPWKFAEGDVGQGARSTAEKRIVIRDEASTTATQHYATSVELTRQSGFALPIVLWTIALLTVLVMMALGAVNRWIDGASLSEKTFRARQLALSGLAIAMNQNVAPNDPLLTKGDPKNNSGESYTVEITNDAGLINPNIFLKGTDHVFFFQALFNAWNVKEADQENAIDGLYDWQSPTELRSAHGAKRGEYEAIGLDGYPPNTPFIDAREMAMVIGFAPIMKAKPNWKKYFSTYNSGKISLRAAPAEILTDLLGITHEQAETWIQLSAGPDGIIGTEDDLPLNSLDEAGKLMGLNPQQQLKLNSWFTISGNVRRIDSKGNCNGTIHHIMVIMRDGTSNSILSWQEE
jgi:hypothetical protein